jgi:hypothetical protein
MEELGLTQGSLLPTDLSLYTANRKGLTFLSRNGTNPLDIALGVLEAVPVSQEGTWCHRMHVCRKHNGDPRRTIDLQKLNEVSLQQCHPTAPPLKQAMTVLHKVKKSVLDAWNGYHSLELREQDRHMTCFITEFGKFQYRVAP